ncbi:4'-phosphopantetheinyl transferase superfamily protein [Ochrobactrum sp. Marseille-Q0166]|uniref:4'-phosphopantetheinyl transferase family protein n=1 Tax=Ochrobactrum sp. Marseille-Q0166 TaxID=2761105 RepID=UPI001655CEE4|nr:4'-phosphopantetheinyl transferase superfamily protein [Ochrobactrum sp. Marseille-Q0166]MBC8719780.1 4'-phosphopantetheinyl transferase superfamily protein [Ochrobactrum sp. Marseille-Q0166]
MAAEGHSPARPDMQPFRLAPWPELAGDTSLFMCRYPCSDLPLNPDFRDMEAVTLPDTFKSFAPRRKAEFIAGQRCAREALRTITGMVAAPHRTANHVPVWPLGTTGSISHCNGYALAIAAENVRYCAVGIDIETLQTKDEAEKIAALVLTRDEMQRLPQQCKGLAVTTAFSAKESLYKALYPQIGRFYGFYAAEMTVDFSKRAGRLRLTKDWSQHWRRGQEIAVHLHFMQNFVLTCVALPAGSI